MYACKRNLMVAMSLSILMSSVARATEVPVTPLTTPVTTPVTTPAITTAPADAKKETLRYQVVETTGKVRVAKIGVDPKATEGWSELKASDFIDSGQQICTFFRAKAKLVAVPSDPPTVLMIEASSIVQISDLEYRGDEAFSRIQIGYGAVRAGVAEGATRSNMEIASPGATLSKKGTDIFRFWYHTPNDWGMSLSDRGRGLIQARQNLQNIGNSGGLGGVGFQSRFVRPGQSVNQLMLRTIETEIFNRFVNVNDMYGLTNGDIKLISLWGNGLNIRGLTGNLVELRDVTGADGSMDGTQPIRGGLFTGVNNGTTLQLQQAINRLNANQRRQPHGNNAGDFGVGQGIVPVNVFQAGKGIQNLTRMNHAVQKSAWIKAGAGMNRK